MHICCCRCCCCCCCCCCCMTALKSVRSINFLFMLCLFNNEFVIETILKKKSINNTVLLMQQQLHSFFLAFFAFNSFNSKSICFLLGASLTTCMCCERRCSCSLLCVSLLAAAAVNFFSRQRRLGASLLRCSHLRSISINCFFPVLVLLPAGCTRNRSSSSSSSCLVSVAS